MNRYLKTCLAGLAALALSFSGLDAATELFRHKGTQFFDSSGDPLAGGKVYYYEAGTSNLQTTYSDAAGSTANSNPIVLDAAGRMTVPVYLGDSDSFSDYKEDLNTSADVAVSPWPFDDIPAAEPTATGAAAPLLLAWTQIASGASPVALVGSDRGNAYEADTTAGNVEFDLPSAASVGDGNGFVFKKIIAANSMIIDQSGSETIDNSATALTIVRKDHVVGIYSNGAEWYKAFEFYPGISILGLGTDGQSLVSDSGAASGLGWSTSAQSDFQQFTASGTWTKPTDAAFGVNSAVLIRNWGAGGSGAQANSGGGGGGGGGGSYTERWAILSDLGATETVTIGAGGASVTTPGDGIAGGNTTFGSLLIAYGGGGGADAGGGGGGGGGSIEAGSTTSSSTGGNGGGQGGGTGGGTAVNGGESIFGGGGGGGGGAAGDAGNGGYSHWGGGAGGGGDNTGATGASIGGGSYFGGAGGGGGSDEGAGGAGGTSVAGGNGGAGATGADNATAGVQPGGGGGGSETGDSGAGGDGRVDIIVFSVE
jgi:hypothetical protein